MKEQEEETIYGTLMDNEPETITFVDIDTAIDTCEKTVRINKLLTEIKAYLFDVTNLGSKDTFSLEDHEMNFFSILLREYELDLDCEELDVILDIEECIIETAIGRSDKLYTGTEREATILWGILEGALEKVQDV